MAHEEDLEVGSYCCIHLSWYHEVYVDREVVPSAPNLSCLGLSYLGLSHPAPSYPAPPSRLHSHSIPVEADNPDSAVGTGHDHRHLHLAHHH